MRLAFSMFVVFLCANLSLAQEWVERDGVEYNCEVLESIIAQFGNEPLLRQPGLLRSVGRYFEMHFPTCPDPSLELLTDEANAVDGNETATTDDVLVPNAEEGCYPHDAVSSRTSVAIRSNYLQFGSIVGHTDSNEPIRILSSIDDGGTCWLQISAGWIRESTLLRPAETLPTISPETESQASCYAHDTAYVTGTMNIRREANVASTRVGSAGAGEAYTVSRSQHGESWCWLKISRGWMAVTGYVTSNLMDVLPPIEGEEWFKRSVVGAFDYLGSRSTRWFNYTVPRIQRILPDADLDANARVIAPSGRVSINNSFVRTSSNATVAAALVHEACHVKQWNEGKRSLLGWELERECYGVEATALSHISPGHRDVKELRCWAENYPITSLCRFDWD